MSFSVISNQPVVIDNGTGTIKAGIAGEDYPSCVAPSFVGRPKHLKVMSGNVDKEYYVGNQAEEIRGLLKLQYPVEHGIVTDWDDMEKVWRHVLSNELNINPDEHPMLLTDAPLNPIANREKACEILFEHFNVPAVYISMQAVLSLYASGRTTGVVLDSGDGVSHSVPVYEGFALPHAIQRIDVAGRDVTDLLQRQLRRSGHRFVTSAEREIVKQIKEEACYLSPSASEDDENRAAANPASYALPDGSVISLGAERTRAPEVLFDPSLVGSEEVGIHHCLVDSIQKSDMDLRRTLYSNIVLSGGTTLMRGFGDRLVREVKNTAPEGVRIRVSAPPERKYSTWMGGSILAGLSTFKDIWVSAREYGEDRNCIRRKLF